MRVSETIDRFLRVLIDWYLVLSSFFAMATHWGCTRCGIVKVKHIDTSFYDLYRKAIRLEEAMTASDRPLDRSRVWVH